MGPPSYMRSVVDRNVVMRRILVVTHFAWEDKTFSPSRRTINRKPPETAMPFEERPTIRSVRVVSKVHLGRSLSLNLPVCDIQVRCTWHSTMDNERWGARMVINSHHAKMLFGMPSLNVRTLRNSVWYRDRSLLRCVGGETPYITSSRNQGDAIIVHRAVRSQSPVGVVGCVLFVLFWTRFLGVWERSMFPLRRSIATLHPCGHIGF